MKEAGLRQLAAMVIKRQLAVDNHANTVAAPEGRSRVGFSLCEAAEREGVRSEAPRGRGAAGAETSAEGAMVEAP